MTKTILITGANGQLGSAIQKLAPHYPDYTFHFTDIDTLDILNKELISDFVRTNQIQYIVNCAAYTAVDKAEDNADSAMRINCDAVRNIGEVAKAHHANVIHISTDYVFDGTGNRPYREDDPVNPTSVYGSTKLAGEKILQQICPESVIIRTAWLYSEYGANFVKTMIRLGKERSDLNVVSDQIGTPTYAGDLADAIITVLNHLVFTPGIYHFSNEGVCSWYDFASAIIKQTQLDCRVHPISTKEYPTPAKRPAYSVLDKTKIKQVYDITIPEWETSLDICLQNLQLTNEI
ncbi:MAG: dTDP-4-dehydrorhamnose reductase [Tannerella sp.]|jgi:dTDP-4-dehydrorhamnose reductase|nr:dTDP-4-dehydrorhamnose reductase [Tannerella sp.]